MTQTVKVPLASNALYVSGTVNGVNKVWTREEGNWWSTQADRATDGVYRVVLSIVYGDGKTTEDSITLYYGLVLVTDRTEQDVINGTEKGWYSDIDLNRVGSAMVYLRDRLNSNGYSIDINPRVDWKDTEKGYDDEMEYYLRCVGTIKSAFNHPVYSPDLPREIRFLSYQSANDIEKVLEITDELLTNSLQFLFYSGELHSGEVI